MFKPLHDNVVLKLEKVEKKTSSGIILTGEQSEQPQIARVIAVGPGSRVNKEIIPPTVKIGDRVVFKKYSSTDFKYNDEEYLLIAEKDILVIMEV